MSSGEKILQLLESMQSDIKDIKRDQSVMQSDINASNKASPLCSQTSTTSNKASPCSRTSTTCEEQSAMQSVLALIQVQLQEHGAMLSALQRHRFHKADIDNLTMQQPRSGRNERNAGGSAPD